MSHLGGLEPLKPMELWWDYFGIIFFDDHTRMNPRGRWRRSRNLRRVPTTEEAGVGEGSKISPLRRLYSSKTPLLEVFFLDIAFIIASDRLPPI